MDMALLVGACLLLLSIASASLSQRLGLPALLLFLGLGLILGDGGFGIAFSDATLAHDVGFAALVFILAEGGFTTRWSDIKPTLLPSILLATLGVAASIGLTAVFCHWALGMPWAMAILLGAIVSSTDAAAVFSVLRNVGLPHHVRSVLESESGLNDAPTVLVVVAMTSMAAGHQPDGGVWGLLAMIAFELIAGVAIGLAAGVLGVVGLRSVALPAPGLYPLATLGWAVMSYGLGVWLHASGFASVYVCSLVLGNGMLPHRRATRSFIDGMGWIAQIGLFIMLGLLASPGRITMREVVMALVAGAFLTLVARPLSVMLCALPFPEFRLREQIFVSWAGLRGAVPIILATIPLAAGIPHAIALFDLVFIFVIVFTLVQGPTLPWLARRLGLAVENVSEVEVESAPLERIHAELMHVVVPQSSLLAGVSLAELRLPKNVVVSLVVRGQETFAPTEADIIRRGDELLIVTPAHARDKVVRRITEVDTHGRLARWRRRA